MKIKMVCSDGFSSIGFRKMVSYIELLNTDTTAYYASPGQQISKICGMLLVPQSGLASNEFVDAIAADLVDADILGFSSTTDGADMTRRIIRCVREKSKKPFIIWGGVHPIVCPEDAVTADLDAICTGEGEAAFREFFEAFSQGRDFRSTRNFWFKEKGTVIKNNFRPLASPAEMDLLPFPKYGGREFIYKQGKGFVQTGIGDYLDTWGLCYLSLWTIGCPFSCAYCSNSTFTKNDPKYRHIRWTTPRYVIEEVKRAKGIHPHISFVSFVDDSFMAVKFEAIREFAEIWHEEVKMPFVVYGVIPNYVREDKLEVLTWAGMNRVRMGIQSGSQRILDFYHRPTPVRIIEEAARTLHKFRKYHIAPSYDIIVDNPIETRADVIDTLELLYRLPRPYFLLIFSLRIIPNTELEHLLKQHGVETATIKQNYLRPLPSLSNILLYMLTLCKPPRRLFEFLLQYVHAFGEEQKLYPRLAFCFRFLYLMRRGFALLRHMDFSQNMGRVGYLFWKLGIIGMWQKYLVPKQNHLQLTEKQGGEH